MKEDKRSKAYQLKITLSGFEPAIWRRFLVDGNIGLYKLHTVIPYDN